MLIAFLGRKGLEIEFDCLSNVRDGFFKRIPLRLTPFEFRAPRVEAMLVLLDDHARFTDHAQSLAYPRTPSPRSFCPSVSTTCPPHCRDNGCYRPQTLNW